MWTLKKVDYNGKFQLVEDSDRSRYHCLVVPISQFEPWYIGCYGNDAMSLWRQWRRWLEYHWHTKVEWCYCRWLRKVLYRERSKRTRIMEWYSIAERKLQPCNNLRQESIREKHRLTRRSIRRRCWQMFPSQASDTGIDFEAPRRMMGTEWDEDRPHRSIYRWGNALWL